MKRREFITLLGGAAATRPLAARTQTPIGRTGKLYRVAVLVPAPEIALRGLFDELLQQGLIEGQNLTIDRSGFNTDYEQLQSRAAELIKARPDAIFCAGDEAPAEVFRCQALAKEIAAELRAQYDLKAA
jgi:putative ABC transport system substrate-binding protein